MKRGLRILGIALIGIILLPAILGLLVYAAFDFMIAADERRDSTSINQTVVRSYMHGDLRLNSAYGEVIDYYDSHGGFHGDGKTFIEIHDDNHQIAAEIAQRDDWSPMPVSRDVRILVYGIVERGEDIVTHYGPTITNQNREPWIPEVEHGFWILVDRQQETLQRNRPEPDQPPGIHNRYSYNLTIGIYDTDHSILYILVLDT